MVCVIRKSRFLGITFKTRKFHFLDRLITNPSRRRCNEKIKIIKRSELKKQKCLNEEGLRILNLNTKIKQKFPVVKKNNDALNILFMNLSGYFTEDTDSQERVLMEPPLGLIAILSYLNREYKEKINGKIVKSRLDFDGYPEMVKMIKDFEPDIIGISVMTFYKDFVHRAINYIREHGIETPIFLGGPYPTGDYKQVLQDQNLDIMCRHLLRGYGQPCQQSSVFVFGGTLDVQ